MLCLVSLALEQKDRNSCSTWSGSTRLAPEDVAMLKTKPGARIAGGAFRCNTTMGFNGRASVQEPVSVISYIKQYEQNFR